MFVYIGKIKNKLIRAIKWGLLGGGGLNKMVLDGSKSQEIVKINVLFYSLQ